MMPAQSGNISLVTWIWTANITTGDGGELVVYLDVRAVTLVEKVSVLVCLDTEVVDRVLVMIVQARGQVQHGSRVNEDWLEHFSLNN